MRSVTLSKEAEVVWDELTDEFERGEDALMAAEWLLARDPEGGLNTDNPAIQAIITDNTGWGLPSFVFYYSFDPTQVVIEAISKAELDQD